MTDTMTPAQIAYKAAEIASQRGHCKNIEEDSEGRVCFVGALNLAMYGKPYRDETFLGIHHPIVNILTTAAEILRGRGAVMRVSVSTPIDWNNRETTTGEDVVMLLKETAAALDEGEK
jgi:hypothetical protein